MVAAKPNSHYEILGVERHDDHDHGYYFISTFIEDHLRHHAALLGA